MSSKKRDRRIAREIRIRQRATATAFEESVKDNLADRVIDNFVAGLAGLPFENRLGFCAALLAGDVDQVEENVEAFARALHLAQHGADDWNGRDEAVKDLRRKQARNIFNLGNPAQAAPVEDITAGQE